MIFMSLRNPQSFYSRTGARTHTTLGSLHMDFHIVGGGGRVGGPEGSSGGLHIATT